MVNVLMKVTHLSVYVVSDGLELIVINVTVRILISTMWNMSAATMEHVIRKQGNVRVAQDGLDLIAILKM